ncbi:MAG: tRNA pseudouridine(38-40) synthase TruA [Planctomycetota bacterium]|nr:MAG: tRNA pseudouridine(38-40) synthase TruA [Planctomycetota bacterium]
MTELSNYHIIIEYDGTNYSGWQIQNDKKTIQGEIQIALNKIYQQKVNCTGAGRTDAGVHALGQSASFQAPDNIAIEKIPLALNANLPNDIVIKNCTKVNADFHPRYNALTKRYDYKVLSGHIGSALERNKLYHYRVKLDINLVKEASLKFIGEKDFGAFSCLRGSETGDENTIRTIYSINITENNQILNISIKGSGFLYKMVRMIVGTLLQAGSQKISLNEIDQIFETSNRQAAGPAVPGHGLYLIEVGY